VVASINPFTPGTRSPPRPPARVTLTQSRAQAGGPAHHPPRRAAPPEREPERERAMDALPEAWSQVRAPVIVPLLRLAVAVCLTMSVLLFLERVYMAVVISGVRLLRLRPDRRYRCDPLPEDDPELGSSAFPVVLVQIPMFNEREVRTPPPAAALHCSAMPPLPAKRPLQRFYSGFVGSLITLVALRWCHGRAGVRSLQVYQLSIGAVCGLSWPADRLVVQVLDDSTDEVIKVY
jgi:beta-mannan synthase